ncbi:MAG: hydrogenase nickel incorporation protein HypB [Nitrospinota bacterium]|nr:hydrogenase nickel incorporation protein HypB [Nitrospinota bacterium]
MKIIDVKKDVLSKNDEIAAGIRGKLKDKGILALNFISSPGSGKTTLLVKTIEDLKSRIPIAVIEGDQQTDNDAKRIAATGVPVIQINTQSSCHLDAAMVEGALEKLGFVGPGLLFIENVGNLVCPASYDLGEEMKVALVSVTEGEDKPVKYPKAFRSSSAMVITKTDLLPHLDLDMARLLDYSTKVNPALKVFHLSAKSGDGLDDWYGFLLSMYHSLNP